MTENPKTENGDLWDGTPPLAWAGSVSLGIGLWLLNGGTVAAPPLVLWFAAFLILVGSAFLLIEGRRSFSDTRRLPSAFILPLSIGLGLAVVLALREHSGRYLGFPFPLDDGEGFCLNQALRIVKGHALYPPVGPAPYIVTNYPPLFPALLSVFIDPQRVSFFAGRFLSVVSTIAICLASAGCVRIATGDSRAAWIAGLMVAASPIVYFWAALLRVDVLACALGVIALWIAMRSKGPAVLWSLPLLLAAIFTRQSSIEAAVAIALGLFLSREPDSLQPSGNRKYAYLLVAGWIVGLVLILLLLQNWSDGQYWLHTVTYTRTEFYWDRAVSNFVTIFKLHAVLFVIALFALPNALTDSRRRIIGIFFLASFATALLSGKVGSDMNYFLNLTVAASCLAGFFASDLFRAARSPLAASRLIGPAMLLIPAALIQSGFLEGDRFNSFTPDRSAYNYSARVVEVLSSAKGPILCEDEGYCMLSGHEVLFNPFIMSELAGEGLWDQTPLIQSIQNKEFDLIMLRFWVDDPNHDDLPGIGTNAGWDRFTPEMERAISENYELDPDAIDLYATWDRYMRRRWFIYRPATGNPPVRPDSPSGSDLLGNS